MCGRFMLIAPGRIVAEHFQLDTEPDLQPRYNIAPSQDVAVIRSNPQSGDRELVMLRWGLIPFWAKEANIGYKMINARGEDVAKKPAFRAAFRRRRCLVPANGFYEWKTANKKKLPYLVQMSERRVFAFAGMWEHWEGPEGEVIESCTIITTDANDLLERVHDRMPVIVAEEDYQTWLSAPEKDSRGVQNIIGPYPPDRLEVYPVSRDVNKVSNKSPHLIEPTGPEIREEAES